MQLIKTEYSIRSGYPIVRRTLEDKMKLVNQPGFGPESCCAVVQYRLRGNIRYAFGNSRMQVSTPPNIYTHSWVRLHAEMAALVAAIDRIERFSTSDVIPITAAYIELRPCEANCMQALRNILPDDACVYYSFDHPTEVEEWKLRAHELCRV